MFTIVFCTCSKTRIKRTENLLIPVSMAGKRSCLQNQHRQNPMRQARIALLCKQNYKQRAGKNENNTDIRDFYDQVFSKEIPDFLLV